MNEIVGNNLDGIADIAAPSFPGASGSGTLLFIVMIAILIIVLAILLYRRRLRHPRQNALRLLTRLDVDYANQPICRVTAFRLAAILRHGLGLSRICLNTRLPGHIGDFDERWNGFINDLYRARYAPTSCDEHCLKELIKEGYFWLRTWP